MLQKYWLSQQKELVKLTKEREEQLASLDLLKKQITVLQQKKVRTESESCPHPCSAPPQMERTGRGMGDLCQRKPLVLLCVSEQ